MGIGEKYYEEHDGKAQDVLGTAGQRGGELSHSFVEADVLKYLEGHVGQVMKEEKRKALNSALQGPVEATRVAKPNKENERSTEEGRVSALRHCWGGESQGTLIQAKNRLTAFMLLYCV